MRKYLVGVPAVLLWLFPGVVYAADAPWRADSAVIVVHTVSFQDIARVYALVDDVWAVEAGGVTCLARLEERKALDEAGLPYDVLFPTIDALRTHVFGSPLAARQAQAAYQRYPEMVAALDALIASHRQIAARVVLGRSVQDREIVGVRISNIPDRICLDRPGVALVGVHHAREWIAMEVPFLIARYLIEQYGSDPAVTRLVDTRELWVIPCLNPDGLEWSHAADRYWRKNMRDNDGDGRFGEQGDGVDLNRNYARGFGGEGSSGDPSSETYRGPRALSEPESAAYAALFQRRPFDTSLSYHNFSQLVLYPWGDSNVVSPDHALFSALGQSMASAIYAVHGKTYTPQRAAQLYLASGDSDDHLYAYNRVAAFTIELRPPSSNPGFELPASEIMPTFEENLPAALYLADLEPDVAITSALAQWGTPARIVVVLANQGRGPAHAVARLYLDRIAPSALIAESAPVLIASGQSGVQVNLWWNTPAPGLRTLYVCAESRLLTDADPSDNQWALAYPIGAEPTPTRIPGKAAVLHRTAPGQTMATDGSLMEWRAVQRIARFGHALNADYVEGPASVVLDIFAAWDDERLYLACAVDDPDGRSGSAQDPLGGDTCVLRFDRADAGGWYRPAHYSVVFGGLQAAPFVRVRRGNGVDNWDGAGNGWPSGTAASSAGALSYVYECAVEWCDLGGVPQEGTVWGLDLSFVDRDGVMRGEVFWDGNGDQADTWGRLEFGGVPADYDRDGVPDGREARAPAAGQSNVYLPDSDGDGLWDGVEDADRNGSFSAGETRTRSRDTDGDRMEDGIEVRYLLTDPTNPAHPAQPPADTDGDALPDGIDLLPSVPDIDGDRFKDGYEAVMLDLGATGDAYTYPPLGDLDRDGRAANLDALMAQSFFLFVVPAESVPGLANADANRDGYLTNVDSLAIQAFFLQITALWPL